MPHAPHHLSRRCLLGGALAACAGVARAEIVNMCVVGKDGWLFPIWDEVRHTELSRVGRVTATINAAVAALKAAKVEVALSLTPAKSRVYREFLPDDFRFSPDAEKRYGMALDELRKPGTSVADQATLFAALRRAQPATQYFFKADTHWTAIGAEAAAAEVAKTIKAGIKLPPSASAGAQLGPPKTVEQDRNDLGELLPAASRAHYPLETYALREPVAAAGGLLDADVTDTVVIGNSYMQPKFGFASALSNQLNRPVALSWRVHQYSPYWMLRDYVKSDAFKRQRPRLIVWNFQETDMEATPENPGAWGPNAMSASSFLADLHGLLAT